MRRTVRLFLCQCLVAALALPLSAAAQETRGKISGTVRALNQMRFFSFGLRGTF